jgi:type IV fimbrial biogenesis protein FimT
MATRFRPAGLSLIEVLTALLIVAVLLTISAPGFSQLIEQEKSRRAIEAFRSLFHFARSHAVYTNKDTTVCAIDTSGRCVRNWQGSARIIVFVDRKRDRRLDPDDLLLRDIAWPTGDGSVRWRSALGRPYITFLQMGNTWQNGTLYYCPHNNNAAHAAALVINQAGRGYSPGDSNNDGIDEDRAGKNITCPG